MIPRARHLKEVTGIEKLPFELDIIPRGSMVRADEIFSLAGCRLGVVHYKPLVAVLNKQLVAHEVGDCGVVEAEDVRDTDLNLLLDTVFNEFLANIADKLN